MTPLIRKATIFDKDYLAENVRESDRDELLRFSGSNMKDCMANTPLDDTYVWEVDNKLACMFGVTSCGHRVGIIWLMATDIFNEYDRVVARETPKIFKELIKGYDVLFNHVSVRNRKAIRWIKSLGFTMYDPEPVGALGEMFCRFEVRNV